MGSLAADRPSDNFFQEPTGFMGLLPCRVATSRVEEDLERMESQKNITQLLDRLSTGEEDAFDQLLPLIYDNLKKIAHRKLRKEHGDRALQTTALVHEAYLKLADQGGNVDWKNRAHFFGVAARAMRQILVDQARRRKAQKRGGDRNRTTLTSEHATFELNLDELIDLDQALDKLAKLNERQSRVVEYRFFGGLDHKETAEIIGCSGRTVRRDWKKARLFLSREMYSDKEEEESA